MNFSEYAKENYTNRGDFDIPRGFADVTKMNTVDGETQDYSLISPLRVESYTETAIVGSVMADLVGLLLESEQSSPANRAIITAGTAVAGLAAAIRQRAKGAVDSVIRPQG